MKIGRLLVMAVIILLVGMFAIQSSCYALKSPDEAAGKQQIVDNTIPPKDNTGGKLASNANIGGKDVSYADIIALPAFNLAATENVAAITQSIENAVAQGKIVVVVGNSQQDLDTVAGKFASIKEKIYLNLVNVGLGDLNVLFDQYGDDIMSQTLDRVQDPALREAISNI
ncbi:MAG: hypothetical protein KKH08_07050 [Candidatus Omnitrophica bacterium]|nr:hypothetical protein [Candidatus Omnitrophota bacterium]